MINQLILLINNVNSIKTKKLLSGLSKHYIYVLCVLFLYLESRYYESTKSHSTLV